MPALQSSRRKEKEQAASISLQDLPQHYSRSDLIKLYSLLVFPFFFQTTSEVADLGLDLYQVLLEPNFLSRKIEVPMQSIIKINQILEKSLLRDFFPRFDSSQSSGFLDCSKSCTIPSSRKLLCPSTAPQLCGISLSVGHVQCFGIPSATY